MKVKPSKQAKQILAVASEENADTVLVDFLIWLQYNHDTIAVKAKDAYVERTSSFEILRLFRRYRKEATDEFQEK
jgi:hypothetical protein